MSAAKSKSAVAVTPTAAGCGLGGARSGVGALTTSNLVLVIRRSVLW